MFHKCAVLFLLFLLLLDVFSETTQQIPTTATKPDISTIYTTTKEPPKSQVTQSSDIQPNSTPSLISSQNTTEKTSSINVTTSTVPSTEVNAIHQHSKNRTPKENAKPPISASTEAVGKLKDDTNPNDAKDFIRFVQTAIESKDSTSASNDKQRVVLLIKNLFRSFPNLRARPCDESNTQKPHQESRLNSDNFEHTNFNKQPDKYQSLSPNNQNLSHQDLPLQLTPKNFQQTDPLAVDDFKKNQYQEELLSNSQRKSMTTNIENSSHGNLDQHQRSFRYQSKTNSNRVDYNPTSIFHQYERFNVDDAIKTIHEKLESEHPKYQVQNNKQQMFNKNFDNLKTTLREKPNQYQSFEHQSQANLGNGRDTPARFQHQEESKTPEHDFNPNQKDLGSKNSNYQPQRAKYSFATDVQDDINGNLHQRQESRDGSRVTGSYTYEDGFFRRTVHYIADENGYRVVKEVVNEIGRGPSYNPDGTAKVHSFVAGKEVDYRITGRYLEKMSQDRFKESKQHFNQRIGWWI